MTELSDTDFILQVARAVVEEIAPEELVSFPLLAEIYREDQDDLHSSKRSGAGNVGTGIGSGEVFTTIAWIIVIAVSQGVLQGARDAVAEKSKTLSMKMLERMGRLWPVKNKDPMTALPAPGQDLSPEELQTLRTFFHKTLLESGVKDPRAIQIANSIALKWVIEPVNKDDQQ